MMMKCVVICLLLPAIVFAKPSPKFDYEIPDEEDDVGPPAPDGEPFLESEGDAMDYILHDNDPIEKKIADGTIRHVLVDGDIYSPPVNESSRHKRNAVRDQHSLWPGGVVPYILSPYFQRNSQLAILAAMQRFHDKTCIRFKRRTYENDFIYIKPAGGCWSLVGRVGGEQTVSLGATCKTKRGTIMHEFMHVLGFRHEHNRPDRDGHVVIYWRNIADHMEDNFKKYSYAAVDLLDAQYDFGSIMHYPMHAFSKNGAATLSPRYTTYKEVGFRNDFSDLDVWKINQLYKCGVCQDTDHSNCPIWAMAGSCYANREWMSKNCAFSCFMCRSTSYGACNDHHSSCREWAKAGECKRSDDYLEKQCPLSCGACPMDPRNRQDEMQGYCHDTTPLCREWSGLGECPRNKGYMKKKCKESCGSCKPGDKYPNAYGVFIDEKCYDKGDRKQCKRWAWMGDCISNPEGTKDLCRKSCGYCGRREGCTNLNKRCLKWAKNGECKNSKTKKFMSKFCAPACGLCTPSPEELETNQIGSAGTNKHKAGKAARNKNPATVAPPPQTTTPTTSQPPEPTRPLKSAKKNKKNKNTKKNNKNKKKNNRQSQTRQLRPDALPAMRSKAEEKRARKLARARMRLERAQNMTRNMEEKRLQIQQSNEDTVSDPVEVNQNQEQVNPVQEQLNQVDEQISAIVEQISPIEDQVHHEEEIVTEQISPIEDQVHQEQINPNPLNVDFSGKSSQVMEDVDQVVEELENTNKPTGLLP